MIEGLKKLVELKQIDDQLAALEEEAAASPGRRERIAQARTASEEKLAEARAAGEKAELEQRHLETEVQDQEALRLRLEGQSAQVKTNEAYTALLHEIEQANAAISERETRILELMDEIEAARARIAAAVQEHRSTSAELDAELKALDERDEQVKQELGRVRAAREELARGIDAPMLSRYEKVAARRRPAVAVVFSELCMGCRVGIPPQQYIEILRGESIVACESCMRILIHQRWVE